MNTDIAEGKWKQIRGSIQAKWGEITNDDLDRIKGNRDQLVGVVQEKYGQDKDRVRKEVNDYLDTL